MHLFEVIFLKHFIPLSSRQFLKYLTVETDDFSVSLHSFSCSVFEAYHPLVKKSWRMLLHSVSTSILSSQVNWLFIAVVRHHPWPEACCWSLSFFTSLELININYLNLTSDHLNLTLLSVYFPSATKCHFATWAINISVNIHAARDSQSGSSARSVFLFLVKWFFMFVLLAASICNGPFLITGANGFLDSQ